jgi:hypothetical protein
MPSVLFLGGPEDGVRCDSSEIVKRDALLPYVWHSVRIDRQNGTTDFYELYTHGDWSFGELYERLIEGYHPATPLQ